MRIVFSSPDWVISGVNSFTLNLMRGLQHRGHDVQLLIVPNGGTHGAEIPLPTDVDVKVLNVDRSQSWFGAQWAAITSQLNERAPLVYFPNYDFDNSSVAPCLDDRVGIVGTLHSDDPHHYEHLERLGRFWNAAIAVSAYLHGRTLQIAPTLESRAFHIGYGVPHPETYPESRTRGHRTLRILFSGRFYEPQKRVSDLSRIARLLWDRHVPFHFTLIGGGHDAETVRAAFEPFVEAGVAEFAGILSPDEILARYHDADVFILTSEYEGLPVALLEAMSAGCIPVVTDLRSGIPEVIRHGENGFRLPVGDVHAFADTLAKIQADTDLRAGMSRAAFETVARGPFSINYVTDRYEEVAGLVWQEITSGRYIRPRPHRPGSWTGDVMPPPALQISPDAYYSLKWRVERQAEEIETLKRRLEEVTAQTYAARRPFMRFLLRRRDAS